MKLKRGNDIIDVPENKVAFFLHAGYIKVEEPVKKSKESEHDYSQDRDSVFEKLTGRKDR
jgi:hypothetical protein